MAGSELSTNMTSKSYSLFINAGDKISGNNNNASYNVNWDDLLPRDYDSYKMGFSFQTGGGNYKDSSAQFLGTISVTGVLTVTNLVAGYGTGFISIGSYITGVGVPEGCIITGATPVNGGNGNYQVFPIPAAAVATIAVPITMYSNIVYSGTKIVMDTQGKSFTYDSTTRGESNILGYAQRDIQSSTSVSNSYNAFYLQFPPKTISRPNQNIININLYNLNYNTLLTDTDAKGNKLLDCTTYTIILEFTPILDSYNKLHKY